MKKKVLGALSTAPIIAASTMSSSCASGCPYGILNDPYPGQCPRFVDVDGDGICDLSQPTTGTESTSTDSDTGTNPSEINDQPQSSDQAQPQSEVITDDGVNISDDGTGYFVLPVSMLIIGAYFITFFLFKKGFLKRDKHRRIWNILVTGGYLGTGITGLLLTILINLGIRTALNPSITFWHAELAILMTIGTLIHVHLYWKPFKNIFRVLFGQKKSRIMRNSSVNNRSK
jgi:hypothetical protein